MSKHSAGPWVKQTVQADRKGYEGWDVYAVRSRGGNLCLAVVGEVDRATDTHNSANADIIAAAPELLESLEALTEWMRERTGPSDGTRDMLIKATEIIAKARGNV